MAKAAIYARSATRDGDTAGADRQRKGLPGTADERG